MPVGQQGDDSGISTDDPGENDTPQVRRDLLLFVYRNLSKISLIHL